MKQARQKPISVSSRQRRVLGEHKRRYEKSVREKKDWGEFLGTMALLGLAAVGVYHFVEATRRSRQSVDVECPVCHKGFVMAVPEGTGRAVHTVCPDCKADLAVDLFEKVKTSRHSK